MIDNNDIEWVVIATTDRSEEAAMWFDLLNGAGIEVRLKPELDSPSLYPGVGTHEFFELSTRADLEQEARKALEEIDDYGETADYDE